MTDELKECPFCGSMSNLPWEHEEDCWIRMWSDQYEDWFTNGFNGEFDRDRALEHKFDRHSNDDMLAAWNTRYKRTCRKVPGKMGYQGRKVVCSECGYGLGDTRWSFCPKCGAEICGEEAVDGD